MSNVSVAGEEPKAVDPADPVRVATDAMLKQWAGITEDFAKQIDAQVERLTAIVTPPPAEPALPPEPVIIHMPASTEWQTLDSAPKTTPPTSVLLFIPYSKDEDVEGRRVITKANEQVVGWWSIHDAAWVTSNFQKGGMPVYPSRWQALPDDPVKA